MRFAEIFKTELFSKYGQKAGCYINEIYDITNFKSFLTFAGFALYNKQNFMKAANCREGVVAYIGMS